jgi:alpha/beta hydrolase family protein
MRKIGFLTALVALSIAQVVDARVTRFVVEDRVPFAGGMEWGTAGAYERLKGTAYMEVDPRDPLDAVIVNLDRAPLNARGMVEFSSPFLILKPVDMSRGNRKIWYGMNNRGNCGELSLRGFPRPVTTAGCNPLTADDVGANNVLLREGYAFVDAGWHGDGLPSPTGNQLFPNFPVARQLDGSSIIGPNRVEIQTATNTFTQPLVAGWRNYEAADTNTARSTLTVRDRADAPRTTIASDRWAFGTCPTGQASLVATTTNLCLFDGFVANKIYELVYPAKDPIVMGLAYAVTRDIGSYLRYETHDDAGNPNPLALSSSSTGIRRAYSSGTSSTGMYQREFLYLGFNEDESRRQVFDAATIYSAATHRLFANVQFAHPTFFSGQDQHRDYTSTSIAPFTLAVKTDPITGIRDGILKRPGTDPLVLQIDEELVFWQWKASLNVVNALGRRVPIPDNARLYFQNGWGHIGAAGLLAPPQPPGICQNMTQGLAALVVTPRALAKVIDDWADRGIAPPKSNYPGVEKRNTLVSLEQYRAEFPTIPGVQPPSVMNELNVLYFGPFFDSEGGIQSLLPPVHGASYEVLVPKPGKDGDGAAGINTIWTRAPLGTNVGWNIRAARAPDLCSLSGSYIPFANTRAERIASGDERQSLEERYGNHQGFVRAVRQAARQLVRERFMLDEDADTFIEAAQNSDVLR